MKMKKDSKTKGENDIRHRSLETVKVGKRKAAKKRFLEHG